MVLKAVCFQLGPTKAFLSLTCLEGLQEPQDEFEKGPGSKLFLRRITFEDNAGDSTDAMYSAVVRSNLQPLVSAFGIGAYSPNGRGSVIEITDYVNGDNDIFFFSSASVTSVALMMAGMLR